MQIQLEQLQHQEDALSSILNFMGEDVWILIHLAKILIMFSQIHILDLI